MEDNPGYVELSDRVIRSWASASGVESKEEGCRGGLEFSFGVLRLLACMCFDHVFSSKEPGSSTLLKHLGTHEYIGDPLVEWTTKGAVMPVKNQGQFDS